MRRVQVACGLRWLADSVYSKQWRESCAGGGRDMGSRRSGYFYTFCVFSGDVISRTEDQVGGGMYERCLPPVWASSDK